MGKGVGQGTTTHDRRYVVRPQALEDLRERVQQMMVTQPAETTAEVSWLVEQLEMNKEVLLGIIDHLISEEA